MVIWEQELFQDNGVLYETIMGQKSREDVFYFWSLEPSLYIVIALSKLDMDMSTMLLTNESINYGTSKS